MRACYQAKSIDSTCHLTTYALTRIEKKMNMIKHSKWQNETRTINPLSHSISAIIHQQKFYCMQIIVIFDLCAHESLHFARGFIFVESSLRLG